MGNEISIVIPVYNGANYIKRCIQSILTQDYTGFQIILVDDGSKSKFFDSSSGK